MKVELVTSKAMGGRYNFLPWPWNFQLRRHQILIGMKSFQRHERISVGEKCFVKLVK
jgi:hypothetical protein